MLYPYCRAVLDLKVLQALTFCILLSPRLDHGLFDELSSFIEPSTVISSVVTQRIAAPRREWGPLTTIATLRFSPRYSARALCNMLQFMDRNASTSLSTLAAQLTLSRTEVRIR